MTNEQIETPLNLRAPEDRLKKAGIRHFDELIHDQPKAWLIKNFGSAGGKYSVNVARPPRGEAAPEDMPS